MFDNYKKNHFYNESMHKYNYGNHSQDYKEDAIHYDRINYLYQDYNLYSNANSYDYGFRPTFNDTKFFEILMRINPIPLIHLLFLKIHVFTLDHMIFILLPLMIKLTIVC